MHYELVQLDSDETILKWFEKIKEFCALTQDDPKHSEAKKNMAVDSWEENPACLLYLLLKEKRFSGGKGVLQLLLDQGRIIAVSGFYRSDFDPNTYIMGVRSWTLKEYRSRHLLWNYLMPLQVDEIRSRGGKIILITFNKETDFVPDIIRRANRDPNVALKFHSGQKFHEIFNDMRFLEMPVNIKHTKQWIVIKKLTDYDFDWKRIAY